MPFWTEGCAAPRLGDWGRGREEVFFSSPAGIFLNARSAANLGVGVVPLIHIDPPSADGSTARNPMAEACWDDVPDMPTVHEGKFLSTGGGGELRRKACAGDIVPITPRLTRIRLQILLFIANLALYWLLDTRLQSHCLSAPLVDRLSLLKRMKARPFSHGIQHCCRYALPLPRT